MRGTLVVLLLASLVLSGCSDSKDDEPTPATSSSSSSSSTITPAPNHGPAANLTAAVQQGSVPFNVTFDLAGSDPDGDALTWTFDADGDTTTDEEGSALPSNVTFSYATPGLYNATFTVSDGALIATSTVRINATDPAPAASPIEEFSCTVDFPTAGFSLRGSPAGNFGECGFTTIDTEKVLAAATPGSGCTIHFDEDTSDNFSGSEAAVGGTYPAGGEFTMQCQLPDSPEGGEGTIGLQDP
jgi:PKD repeat protein